jgi:small-conductance mechanosensitive channel/CRP-like cAMP-binding protein
VPACQLAHSQCINVIEEAIGSVLFPAVDLTLIFVALMVVGAVALRFVPRRNEVPRLVLISFFFAAETAIIIALIGSPTAPVVRPEDLPRQFWLQILTCCWWGLAARELIECLKLLTRLRKTASENRLLFDVIAGSIYVCAALAMMGFVFAWPLQGLLATSGIIAIVLGLALQSTLSDLFSGISLNIEKPYQLGDEILLEGGIEGQVVQVNWRSTHLRNGANDVVVVPNSAIAKMRIQNHSAGSKRYSGSLPVIVDSRNAFQTTIELLKEAAMACPAILQHPACTVVATDIKGDRVTYEISFSTELFTSSGEARSQLISQIYKRARPATSQQHPLSPEAFIASPIFFFLENEVLDHLQFFDPLSPAEKADLTSKMVRHHFRVGDKLLAQGDKNGALHFIYSGVIQATHQVADGRILDVEKLGPGDTYGELSLMTGEPSPGGFSAVTSGLLLELKTEDLKPVVEGRPELMEALCHYITRMQEFIARFERSALQKAEIHQHDLLWRVKNFFRLSDSITKDQKIKKDH